MTKDLQGPLKSQKGFYNDASYGSNNTVIRYRATKQKRVWR